jgi:hypothetical protein
MDTMPDACMNKDAGTQKQASGVLVYLTEELGDARLRCAQLKKYVKETLDLVEKSEHRDHFFEVAGHLIHGIPDVLLRLDNALDAAAMAAARLDYEEIKNGLLPEKAEELENVLEDVRMRYLKRRSSEVSVMQKGQRFKSQGGQYTVEKVIAPDWVVATNSQGNLVVCHWNPHPGKGWEALEWFKPSEMSAAESAARKRMQSKTVNDNLTRTPMTPRSAAYFLNKIADITEKSGRVPTAAVMALVAKLEKQDRRASFAPKAASAFRSLAYEMSTDASPSRVKLAAVLRRIAFDTTGPIASAGDAFQKANPKITDEEAKVIDEMHEKHENVVKDKHG